MTGDRRTTLPSTVGPTTRRLGTLLIAASVAGCTEAGRVPASRVEVSDSAGIVVVDVGPLEGVEAPTWLLQKVFESSSSGVELFRISSGRILRDGRVLVGDDGNHQVLLLDADGGLQRTIGREGDGPGEFQAITSLHVSSDSDFLAYDTSLGRWTRFDMSGGVESTAEMRPPNRIVDLLPLAVKAKDVLAIYGSIRRFAHKGVRRDTTPLLHFDSAEARPDTLSLWPADEESFSTSGSGEISTPVGFGRSLASAGRSGVAVLGDTDTLDVFVFDAAGKLTMRIRGGGSRIPTTDTEGTRWRESGLARMDSSTPEEVRQAAANAPYLPSYPAFDRVAIDDRYQVWIGSTAVLGAERRRWIVFGADGTAVGVVDMPAGARVLDVAHDFVLLQEEDALDVQHVALFSIHRGG